MQKQILNNRCFFFGDSKFLIETDGLTRKDSMQLQNEPSTTETAMERRSMQLPIRYILFINNLKLKNFFHCTMENLRAVTKIK